MCKMKKALTVLLAILVFCNVLPASAKTPKKNIYAYFINGREIDRLAEALPTLVSYGTNAVILDESVFHYRTEAQTAALCAELKSKGISPYIRIQVWYKDDHWISPLTQPGFPVFRQDIVDQQKAVITDYLKLGFSGIVLDDVLFPGTAEKYGTENACSAITETVKQLNEAAKGTDPGAVLAVMVKPDIEGRNRIDYGQDVAEISKNADVVIPMMYIDIERWSAKEMTRMIGKFVDTIQPGTKPVVALHTYNALNNDEPLSYQKLFDDVKSAVRSGSNGVMLWQLGLSEIIDFTKLSSMPGTGDHAPLALPAAAALLSSCVFLWLLCFERRRSRKARQIRF